MMPAKPSGSVLLNDIDNLLSNAVGFTMLMDNPNNQKNPLGTVIDFQFPPKILSDNRDGNWKEGDLRGSEPIAVYATSGPRVISLNWTYIVEDRDINGSGWTVGKITKNVQNLRGYFSRVKHLRGGNVNLIIKFKMWAHGGDATTFRMKSVHVKHSETIIVPYGPSKYLGIPSSLTTPVVGPSLPGTTRFATTEHVGGAGTGVVGAYPLRTDITADIRLWTNQKRLNDINLGINDEDTNNVINVGPTTIANLADAESPQWY